METIAGIEGVVSIDVDEKDRKITVIGDADPVCLTASLRKFGFADLVSVGPSKEPKPNNPGPEKKPEPDKKQQDKKTEADKKDAEKKPDKKQAEKNPDKKGAEKNPTEQKASEKKAADKQEPSQQNYTYIILPKSCDHCCTDTYYWSEENPNACCIV